MDLVTANLAITEQWIAAFNAHDVDRLLLLYDYDAKHYSPRLKQREPETGGWISGHTALKAWWAGSFERISELKYTLQNCIANETQVFMEYLREAPGDSPIVVAELLEINGGKIHRSRIVGS